MKLINAKYNEANAKTAAYLTWPDARLRAYLRNQGISEDALPTSRPGLLRKSSSEHQIIYVISDVIVLLLITRRGGPHSLRSVVFPPGTNIRTSTRSRFLRCLFS